MSPPDHSASPHRLHRGWLITICLVVLAGLIIVVIHVALTMTAEQRWQAAEARLKAAGESLDILSLAPPPVPDADNFMALPPLKDIAIAEGDGPDKRAPEARRKRLLALEFEPDRNSYRQSGVDHGIAWDAEDLAVANRVLNAQPTVSAKTSAKQKILWGTAGVYLLHLPMPDDTGDPARDVLTGMAAGDTLLAELRAGLNRSKSQFTPSLKDRISPRLLTVPLPHFPPMRTLGRWLGLHAQASVSCGETEMAVDDIRVLLRLAEAEAQEPSMFGSLSVINLLNLAIPPAWSLLRAGKVSEAQAQRLLHDLYRIDIQAVLLKGMRGDLAIDANEADWMAANPSMESLLPYSMINHSDRFLAVVDATLILGLSRLNNPAVCRGNKSALVDHVLDVHITPLQTGGLKELQRSMKRFQTSVQSGTADRSVFGLMPAFFSNHLFSTYSKAALVQARLDQARTACALEAFHARHQHYPAQLGELVPDLLPAVPVDAMAGKPLRYALTADGRYKLWNVGFDAADDGGKVIAAPRDEPECPHLTDSDYPGDWVWSYEPLVPVKP